ncbi:hypothetical protein BLSTO_06133, partial [Blastocystis sp. subtype 1]
MCVEQFKNRALNKCIPLEQVMVTGFDEAASSPSQEKIVKELEELLQQDLSQQDKVGVGLSATTRQTLLAASQLGAEYVSILDNLSMLGVRVESKMEQRMDRSDYQKAVSEAVGREAQAKQLKDSLMTNRYTSQLRFALNDLFTNALSPARFQVYD